MGVVGDVRHRGPTRDVAPTVYVHSLQRPGRAGNPVIVIDTSVEPGTVVDAVRQAIHGVDASLALELSTMESRMADALGDRRFTLLVLGSFALITLILAAVGIYGVISYAVARRTREMGIRMVLGARPGGVLRMVVSRSLRTVAVGVALGAPVAVGLGRFLSGLVYEVAPADPLSLGAALAVLLAVGAASSLLPGLKATRADPRLVMRSE